MHNSAERKTPPRCHPGTRERAIKDIVRWVEESNPASAVWVNGRAGVGRSALMQRIAELGLKYFGGSLILHTCLPTRNKGTWHARACRSGHSPGSFAPYSEGRSYALPVGIPHCPYGIQKTQSLGPGLESRPKYTSSLRSYEILIVLPVSVEHLSSIVLPFLHTRIQTDHVDSPVWSTVQHYITPCHCTINNTTAVNTLRSRMRLTM